MDPYYFVQVNEPEVSNQLEVFTGCLPFNDFHEISMWPKHYTVEFNEFLPEDGYFDHDDEYINGQSQELLAFRQCNFWRGSNNPVLLLPVMHLRLVKCVCLGYRCLSDVFKNFKSLKDLSYLSIIDVDDIDFLLKLPSPPPPLHHELVVSCFNPLQNLQELRLVDLPNLVDLLYWESKASFLPPATFPSLACIMILKCHKLKQLFTVQLLQGLQNLDDSYVDDCEGLEEMAVDDDRVGRAGEGIQSEATTAVILPKLRRLYLNRLLELKHIWSATKICKSLQYINVRDCPKVRRLPLFLPTTTGLPSPPNPLIEIYCDQGWWQSLVWEKSNDNQFFQKKMKNGLEDPLFDQILHWFTCKCFYLLPLVLPKHHLFF